MKNLFRKDKNNDAGENAAADNVSPENGGATKSKLRLDKRMILIICAACLAVVCIVLAIVLPVCLTGGEAVYHKLTYDVPDGVEIVIKNENGSEVKNGWEVKSGLTVTFSLGYDGEPTGDPVVEINDRTVRPEGN